MDAGAAGGAAGGADGVIRQGWEVELPGAAWSPNNPTPLRLQAMLKVREGFRFFVRKNEYTQRVRDPGGDGQPHDGDRSIGRRTSKIRENARKRTSEANLSFAESSADEGSSRVGKTPRHRGGRGKGQGAESSPLQFSERAHELLARGGHVFDSKARSENGRAFIECAQTLLRGEQSKSLSDDDVLSCLRMATLAVNLGAKFISGDQAFLREFSVWCEQRSTECKGNKDIAGLAESLKGWSNSLANDLDAHGTARTSVDVGSVPKYGPRDEELELKTPPASIKKRRIEFVRGAVFKVRNLEVASPAELVALLHESGNATGPKYGARQQLRLCAHVMRHRRDLGPQEQLQVLAHAVVAMRERPDLTPEDQGKAKAMFKQLRRSLVDEGFDEDSEHVVPWLYEFGQRVVNYTNEGGKLPALS